jgi:hypothetical protein
LQDGDGSVTHAHIHRCVVGDALDRRSSSPIPSCCPPPPLAKEKEKKKKQKEKNTPPDLKPYTYLTPTLPTLIMPWPSYLLILATGGYRTGMIVDNTDGEAVRHLPRWLLSTFIFHFFSIYPFSYRTVSTSMHHHHLFDMFRAVGC